jgi:hypothetical protein
MLQALFVRNEFMIYFPLEAVRLLASAAKAPAAAVHICNLNVALCA